MYYFKRRKGGGKARKTDAEAENIVIFPQRGKYKVIANGYP